jgi:hypothetical protein
LADARLKWREWRMRLGVPRRGSSPHAQQRLGLNRDVTRAPRESEGAKLRD